MEAGSEGHVKPVQSIRTTIQIAQHCRLKMVFHSIFTLKTDSTANLFRQFAIIFDTGRYCSSARVMLTVTL